MKYRLYHYYTLFFALTLMVTSHAQYSGPRAVEWNSEALADLQKSSKDSLRIWQEQVVLHTDRTVLAPSDHLFFKAYMLTGPKQLRVSASDVLKLELLDAQGKLLANQYHKITDGTSSGSLQMPKKIAEGEYYIRAYTRWMLNYGVQNLATKKIRIGAKSQQDITATSTDTSVAFYPEGGQLVAELSNRVAIRSNSSIDGFSLVNGSGEQVASIKEYGLGVGTVRFTPKGGEQYFLAAPNGTRQLLPQVEANGYTLQINNLDPSAIKVRIERSDVLQSENVALRGKANGTMYFEQQLEFSDGIAELEIPKKKLPNGLFHLYLEDDLDQVWAERPLAIQESNLNIEVIRSDQNMDGGQLQVKVTDAKGTPVQTELSVALVGWQKAETPQMDAIDALDGRNRQFYNDLLVLTHQSKGFGDSDQAMEIPSEIKYTFQQGLEFYGQAYNLNNVLLQNKNIQMLITTDDDVIAKEVATNDNGLFSISGLEFTGEAKIVFRTKGDKEASKLVKVIPYEYEIPPLTETAAKKESKSNKAKTSRQFVPKRPAAAFTDTPNDGSLIALEEVTLVEKKQEAFADRSVYGIEPSRVVYQDPERPKFFLQLLQQIPGVYVRGNLEFPSLSLIRNNTSISSSPNATEPTGPLWVIDGFIVGRSPGVRPEWGLQSTDVDRIELLNGADAAIYGSRSSQGVILIYTRNGSDEEYLKRKDAQIEYEGFHDSLDFEGHKKATTKRRKSKASGVNTLYWNPEVSTDETGIATISFEVPDEYESIRLDLEAITSDGKMGGIQRVWPQ